MSWASSGCSAPLQVTQEKREKDIALALQLSKSFSDNVFPKHWILSVTTYFSWSSLHAWLLYSHFNLIGGVWGRQINLLSSYHPLGKEKAWSFPSPGWENEEAAGKRWSSPSLPLLTSTRGGSQISDIPLQALLVQWEGRIKLLLLPAETHTDQTTPGPISWELQVEAR